MLFEISKPKITTHFFYKKQFSALSSSSRPRLQHLRGSSGSPLDALFAFCEIIIYLFIYLLFLEWFSRIVSFLCIYFSLCICLCFVCCNKQFEKIIILGIIFSFLFFTLLDLSSLPLSRFPLGRIFRAQRKTYCFSSNSAKSIR